MCLLFHQNSRKNLVAKTGISSCCSSRCRLQFKYIFAQLSLSLLSLNSLLGVFITLYAIVLVFQNRTLLVHVLNRSDWCASWIGNALTMTSRPFRFLRRDQPWLTCHGVSANNSRLFVILQLSDANLLVVTEGHYIAIRSCWK